MATGPGIHSQRGFGRRLVRWWLALTRRKIRTLQAGEITTAVPALFAVSHPAGFYPALVLSMATDYSVRCLVPRSLVEGRLAEYLARQLGMILYEDEQPVSEAAQREAVDALRSGDTVVVFADQNVSGQSAAGTLARTAAAVVGRAEAQPAGRRIAVYPVHLFLPEATTPSREILIYIDSVTSPREDWRAGPTEMDARAFALALESRFRENAFQLRPVDMGYLLSDLENVLQTALQEEWASRPDWKQDPEGFVLSRLVTEWVKQMNYLNPGRLVSLRQSLENCNRRQEQCALRELEMESRDSESVSAGQRAILWLETLLGVPIALYGLLNHLAIAFVLFLAGSFQRNSTRARSAELKIRIAVTLGFYALQIFLVAHWWGRAAAGYYAPTLPASGWYLWRRYVELAKPQALQLFNLLTIPALKRTIKRQRQTLLAELDETLWTYEENISVPHQPRCGPH